MPIYEFKCHQCGAYYEETRTLGDTRPVLCTCGNTTKRTYSPFTPKANMFDSHFNQTSGTVVHSARQFSDDLKRKSEEMTARTGMEHRYVPHDARDAQAVGVTQPDS